MQFMETTEAGCSGTFLFVHYFSISTFPFPYLSFLISTNSVAQAIGHPQYLNTPAFAAMGIYSCTKNLATFFRKLLNTLASESAILEPSA
jgi:hypothetical protein